MTTDQQTSHPLAPEGLKLLLAILQDYFSSIKQISEQKDQYMSLLGEYQQFTTEFLDGDIVRRGGIVRYLTFQVGLKTKIESIQLLVESFIHRFPETAEGQRKKRECLHEIKTATEIYSAKIDAIQKGIVELHALKMLDDIESFDFDRENGAFVRARRFEVAEKDLVQKISQN